MSRIAKVSILPVTLTAVSLVAAPSSAQVVTADVAKQCRALAIKEHPPSAAGKAAYAQAQREAYRNCISQRTRSK